MQQRLSSVPPGAARLPRARGQAGRLHLFLPRGLAHRHLLRRVAPRAMRGAAAALLCAGAEGTALPLAPPSPLLSSLLSLPDPIATPEAARESSHPSTPHKPHRHGRRQRHLPAQPVQHGREPVCGPVLPLLLPLRLRRRPGAAAGGGGAPAGPLPEAGVPVDAAGRRAGGVGAVGGRARRARRAQVLRHTGARVYGCVWVPYSAAALLEGGGGAAGVAGAAVWGRGRSSRGTRVLTRSARLSPLHLPKTPPPKTPRKSRSR